MESSSALSAIQSPFRSPPSSPARPGSRGSAASPASSRRSSAAMDRFIPPRSPLDPDYSNFLLLDDGAAASSGRAAEAGNASANQPGAAASGGDYEAIVPSEYETSLRRQLLQDSRHSNTVLPLTSPSRNSASAAASSGAGVAESARVSVGRGFRLPLSVQRADHLRSRPFLSSHGHA